MPKAFSITIILLTLFSCSNNTIAHEKWENGNSKTIFDFQNLKDSVFIEKHFNEKGELTRLIEHAGSIRNGEWISYVDNIKFSSGSLVNGSDTRGKVTWYYENGSVKTEKYYNDEGNLYQEIGYYEDNHIAEVLFYSSTEHRNQSKSWYGWFPNGNLQYIQDTLAFSNTLNEWNVDGRQVK